MSILQGDDEMQEEERIERVCRVWNVWMHRSMERFLKGHQRGSDEDDDDYKVEGSGGRVGGEAHDFHVHDMLIIQDEDNNENSPNINFSFSAIS